MKDLPELINGDVLKQLRNLKSAGRLAHAYLFTGSKGVGKFETAIALAQAVNCQDLAGFSSGCRCASCRKIRDGNHPDLFIIEKPEDKTEIVIGQITPKTGDHYRPLLPWLSVRALEAEVRVVIIKDADLLNHSAANAFLKTLEEPCPGTLFILTSAAPANILLTVVSRCHEIKFFPNMRGVEFGNTFHASKNGMIDEFILGAGQEALFKKWSSDKEAARELLHVILSFYRDVLCVKNGVSAGVLYNADRLTDINRISAQITPEEVQAIINQAIKAIEAVNENFNVKVALMLLKELIQQGPKH